MDEQGGNTTPEEQSQEVPRRRSSLPHNFRTTVAGEVMFPFATNGGGRDDNVVPQGGNGNGTVTAEQLFRMQWQSIRRRMSMPNGGGGMQHYQTMQFVANNPMFAPVGVNMNMNVGIPSVPSMPSFPIHRPVPQLPHSSATTVSRQMILESAIIPIENPSFPQYQQNLLGQEHQWQEHQLHETTSFSAEYNDGSDCKDGRCSNNGMRTSKRHMMPLSSDASVVSMDNSTRFGLTPSPPARTRSPPSKTNSAATTASAASRDGGDGRGNGDEHLEDEEHLKPKRPLSAYNLFFQHERARLLLLAERGLKPEDRPPRQLRAADVRALLENNPFYTNRATRRHRKSHGKVSFMDLVKHVSRNWKGADAVTRASFQTLAKEEKERYKREMGEYRALRKARQQRLHQKGKSEEKKDDAAKEEVGAAEGPTALLKNDGIRAPIEHDASSQEEEPEGPEDDDETQSTARSGETERARILEDALNLTELVPSRRAEASTLASTPTGQNIDEARERVEEAFCPEGGTLDDLQIH